MISVAHAGASSFQTGDGGFGFILVIAFMVLFYFILWRPQQKRTQDHNSMVEKLQKGDEVVTSGGILGKIKEIQDGLLTLTIAKDLDVRIQKRAVSACLPKGSFKSE